MRNKRKQIHIKCTLEVIKQGFERFCKEYGHYPKDDEIDKCPYLCSSRQIERNFGGTPKVRELLGIRGTDYHKGQYRSDLMKKVRITGINTEQKVRNLLIDIFGEICVHEEKQFGNGRQRVDFFVFAQENFAVEVFSAIDLRSLTGSLNIKQRRYDTFKHKLYFVVEYDGLFQNDLNAILEKKKIKLHPNIKCLIYDEFKHEVQEYLLPLKNLPRYTSSANPTYKLNI